MLCEPPLLDEPLLLDDCDPELLLLPEFALGLELGEGFFPALLLLPFFSLCGCADPGDAARFEALHK